MDFSLVGMWKSMGLPARLVVITLAIMSVCLVAKKSSAPAMRPRASLERPVVIKVRCAGSHPARGGNRKTASALTREKNSGRSRGCANAV